MGNLIKLKPRVELKKIYIAKSIISQEQSHINYTNPGNTKVQNAVEIRRKTKRFVSGEHFNTLTLHKRLENAYNNSCLRQGSKQEVLIKLYTYEPFQNNDYM